MEKILSDHLLALGTAFSAHSGLSLSTLGERVGGDWQFFTKLGRRDLNFRIRTYDRAIERLSANWPADLDWPPEVPRPAAPEADRAGSAATSPTPAAEPAPLLKSSTDELAAAIGRRLTGGEV